jgi:hypothetical protein
MLPGFTARNLFQHLHVNELLVALSETLVIVVMVLFVVKLSTILEFWWLATNLDSVHRHIDYFFAFLMNYTILSDLFNLKLSSEILKHVYMQYGSITLRRYVLSLPMEETVCRFRDKCIPQLARASSLWCWVGTNYPLLQSYKMLQGLELEQILYEMLSQKT